MTTLKLQALPKEEAQPESILCLDNKGDTIAKVWRDKTVTIDNQDISHGEMEQIIAVQQNFDLFYDNLKDADVAKQLEALAEIREKNDELTGERPHNSFVSSSGQHTTGGMDTKNSDTIADIDFIAAQLEDVLHGQEGQRITEIRKLLSTIKTN